MNKNWQHLSVLGAAIAAVSLPVQIAFAQSGGAQSEDELIEEVVTIGSRSKPRSAADSPVPIDSFSAAQLDQQPHGDMTENIKNLVPSFSATPLTGDGSSFVRSTSLRGLPPDEVLLLVNGKRRHRSSLIQHFGAAMSQGAHAADMGHIPSIALKNVEVLRDGAAAQYGSDAIAGVINFVLDDANEGGRLEAQYGQFYEGEQSIKLAGNIGLPLTDSGFANFSFEYVDHEQLIRGHERFDAIEARNAGIANVGGDSPYSNDKKDRAQTWGRPENDGLRTAWNLGLELGNGAEAYMFGNYADTYHNYRFFYREVLAADPSDSSELDGAYVPIPLDPTDDDNDGIPGSDGDPDSEAEFAGNFCWCDDVLSGGHTPFLVGDQTDFSNVVGVRGEFSNGMLYDFSGSYGMNAMDYTLHNTISPTYGPGTSTSNFDTTDLKNYDTSLNADFSYPMSDAVNLAFGFEWREENYVMIAGDRESWVPGPWAEVGNLLNPLDDNCEGYCNYGTPPNGSDGMPGTPAEAAGTFSRDNVSAYVDAEWDISDAFLLQGALRYEDFSDFGTTTNGKIAARFNVSDSFTLRGAYSTGFRAPTPGQSNLQTIVLSFDADAAAQVLEGTLRPTDPLLTSFGGKALEPEDATNLSIGFSLNLDNGFSLTADYYQVDVEDRIVKTFNLSVPDTPEFADVDFNKVAFYTNGLETETSGFDLVAQWSMDWAGGSSTDFSLAWNSNDTKITKVNAIDHDADPATDPVEPVSGGTQFNIENGLPDNRFSFGANHNMDRLALTLRANWYDDSFDEQSGRLRVDSALMVDIEARYDVNEDWTLVVGANNVFDEFPNKVGVNEFPITSVRNHQGLPYPRRTPIGYDGGMWYLKGVFNF
jgi:iron complex outermembrane receptor protein